MEGGVTLLIAAGIATHAIFRKWEPTNIPIVVSLLFILPGIVTHLSMFHRANVVVGILLSYTLFYSALISSILHYRLSPFHPIARYPGPGLCKVSKLYMLWIARQGYQHKYIRALHERYGDVVRIGPNEISIRDVSAIPPLMGSQGLPKGPSWQARGMYQPVPSLIAYRNNAEHARRRKPWNRAFSPASVQAFQLIIVKRVTQLCQGLVSQKRVVDLAQWISFFTYDFIGDMAVALVYDHIPWLPHFAKHIPGAGRDLKRFREAAIQRATERYDAGATSKDLFYYLNNEDGGDSQSPSRSIVIADAVLAVLAGADTTASVLSNTFWLLLNHPHTYVRLQVEVDKFYPRGEDSLNPKHHGQMTYLEAVINEVLRLYPALLSGSQRAPEPNTGNKIVGKYCIPEGTQARIHFWSVHRDPRNFSHPDKFWPERWLIADGLQQSPEEIIHNPKAFIPFSFGPRKCAGKALAMQEMKVLLCHVMQRLRIQLAPDWDPDEWERMLQDKFVIKMGSLPVVVEAR